MRVIFAGTPAAAVPSLEALLASRHEVVAVLTRPDAHAGRGQHSEPSAVARRAAGAGLLLLRPASTRDPEFLAELAGLAPDCCPVTAYGGLIPDEALRIPRHGWVNLHFSLLPAWRGAAPVQHALLRGDDITGATTFEIVTALDAGPVYGVVTEPVGAADTAGDLLARLAVTGAELLCRTLDGIESGELTPVPQPSEGVTRAPKLTTEDARVRWDAPAASVDRQIRACTPAPGAWTAIADGPGAGTRLKLWPVRPATAESGAGAAEFPLAPGQIGVHRNEVLAGTATRPVTLGEVQAGGKRRMPATDWARGLRLGAGAAGLTFA